MVDRDQLAADGSRGFDLFLHQDVACVPVQVEQAQVQDGDFVDFVLFKEGRRKVLNWAHAGYEGL